MICTRVCKLFNINYVYSNARSFSHIARFHWKNCDNFLQGSSNITSNYNVYHGKIIGSKSVESNNRCYSTKGGDETEDTSRRMPTLMEFPEIVWPSIIKSIRNWILANLIIRPYFDNEFNLQDFVSGSKHALQIVSSKLAGGDINNLHGLVASETIVQLQKAISSMSMAQRLQLSISKDDIYFSFPYQIGVIFDEGTDSSQRRWVEITMCYHTLRGLKEMQDQGHVPPLNMGLLPEYRDKISICNYRFLREFTKGVESPWIVNVVNHFRPTDFIKDH